MKKKPKKKIDKKGDEMLYINNMTTYLKQEGIQGARNGAWRS